MTCQKVRGIDSRILSKQKNWIHGYKSGNSYKCEVQTGKLAEQFLESLWVEGKDRRYVVVLPWQNMEMMYTNGQYSITGYNLS